MSPCYVIILMTLLACVTIHEAAPPTRDRSRDWALADKRGGIPSRFRGNSFHNSLHPMVQQRAVLTPTGDDVIDDEDESASRGHDVRTRDFLGAILGMGMSQSREPSQTDRIYNSYEYGWYHGYYGDDDDDDYYDDDWYYDDYYDQYDVTAREVTDVSAPDDVTSANGTEDASDRAAATSPKRRNGADDVTSSERPPTQQRLVSRDYLFTVMGLGSQRHQSQPYRFDHDRYNSHYYYDYDDDDDDDDDYFYDYDYYDYYDYDFDDDDDESDDDDDESDDDDDDSDEESDNDSEEEDRKREFGAQKTRTATVRRDPPTLTENNPDSRIESKRRTPTLSETGHRVQTRDYLGILGMGGGPGVSGNQLDHAHYNEHYYYDYVIDDGDYDYYDYGYYYDDYKREVGKQKSRTATGKRKTPTLREDDIENQLESLHDTQGKTPTVERSRFLQALKRYVLDDDVRRK